MRIDFTITHVYESTHGWIVTNRMAPLIARQVRPITRPTFRVRISWRVRSGYHTRRTENGNKHNIGGPTDMSVA